MSFDNQEKTNPKKLFVGNLPFSATQEQLQELFTPFGQIVDIHLITDRYSGQSKGIAFIEFATKEEADAAIEKMHDSEIDGRKIVVNVAKPRRS